MANNEFKQKIAASNSVNWFNDVKCIFYFPHLNINIPLTGAASIYEYVNQQIKGWEALGSLPKEFEASKQCFVQIKTQLVHFVTNYANQDSNWLTSNWPSRVGNNIQALSSNHTFTYDAAQTEFLLRVNQSTESYFVGAYSTIVKSNNVNMQIKEQFFGALLAYEFESKNFSEIAERRDSEKKSIATLKNNFQNYLSEFETQLVVHLSDANKQYADYVEQLDALKQEKNAQFSEWFTNTKNEEWLKWYVPAKVNIVNLEDTYQEKLKLAEPAEYWKQRASGLKIQGWWALGVLTALVFVSCVALCFLLWHSPQQMLLSWFADDKSAAIRWSIVFATLLAFMGFCIKAVAKVMFSCFHLARDCEERYTLTYFYLSLLKDSSVDDKDRQLIMQSLFSRAETGLLKDDSSPTMPNDVMGKFSR